MRHGPALRHMYPDADVPVFELSLDYSFNDWKPKPMQYHYDLAAELSELRTEGIMIIGSGNIVHNLSVIDWNIDASVSPWVEEFDEKVKRNILNHSPGNLIRYRNMRHGANCCSDT